MLHAICVQSWYIVIPKTNTSSRQEPSILNTPACRAAIMHATCPWISSHLLNVSNMGRLGPTSTTTQSIPIHWEHHLFIFKRKVLYLWNIQAPTLVTIALYRWWFTLLTQEISLKFCLKLIQSKIQERPFILCPTFIPQKPQTNWHASPLRRAVHAVWGL